MSDVIVYASVAKLVEAGGKGYKDVLKTLVKERLIKTFEPCIAITVDKDKALHIGAVLEGFYNKPIATTLKTIKGDK